MPENKKSQLTPIFINLDSALRIWSINLKKIILVYFWGLLLSLGSLAVAYIFFALDAWYGQNFDLTLSIILTLIILVGAIFSVYFYLRAYIGLFLLIKKDFVGQEWKIFQETRKYFWPYFGLALLTLVLIILWSLLLIIPGLIFAVFYSLAIYVFFFEDQRGMAAIRRSFRLIKGYFWPVVARYIVIGVLGWAFFKVLSLPLNYFVIDSAFARSWSVLIQIISLLIAPIILLYTYSIYQDLVKIKK